MKLTTQELLAELQYRHEHPEYFIRDLVEDGYDLDNDASRESTDWMDDKFVGTERSEFWQS